MYINLNLIFIVFHHREFQNQSQSIVPYIHLFIDVGIKYIGGCCHVTPNQISIIRDIIDGYSSKI